MDGKKEIADFQNSYGVNLFVGDAEKVLVITGFPSAGDRDNNTFRFEFLGIPKKLDTIKNTAYYKEPNGSRVEVTAEVDTKKNDGILQKIGEADPDHPNYMKYTLTINQEKGTMKDVEVYDSEWKNLIKDQHVDITVENISDPNKPQKMKPVIEEQANQLVFKLGTITDTIRITYRLKVEEGTDSNVNVFNRAKVKWKTDKENEVTDSHFTEFIVKGNSGTITYDQRPYFHILKISRETGKALPNITFVLRNHHI